MRIEDLLNKLPDVYSAADREAIFNAYKFAEKAHVGQTRASGEAYVSHCLSVADILIEKFTPPPHVIVAGLLHDTVEDTPVTVADVRRYFGDQVARMVDGVTKLTGLPRVYRGDQTEKEKIHDEEQRQVAERRGMPDPDTVAEQLTRGRQYDLKSETLRKTLLAMAEQPEVIMVKLADRLHNMRTLEHLSPQKQRRIAQETIDIFAPLANRLGIWQMKWELEDLAFRYINPDKYDEIAKALAKKRKSREREMQSIIRRVDEILREAGIEAKISGRPKHISSIYHKMMRKGIPFDMLSDVRGVRLLVKTRMDCYTVLGVIHTHWHPIPGEFDDYISAPKGNNYRSLHTAVVYDDGKTVEFQIRTFEMHLEAEQGIAAHWRYKEDAEPDPQLDEMIMNFRSLMDWRQDIMDSKEFVESVKSDVFPDRVYVFTPKGDAIMLPAGATPIDFAYQIHTDIGHRCRGAKVNGKLISLDYTLKTGDKVEIIIAKRGGPSRDWLNADLGLVKTQRAKSKIRHWFKVQESELNIAQGKSILERELRRLGMGATNLEDLAHRMGFQNTEDFLLAIGCGDLATGKIVNLLSLVEQEKESEEEFDLSDFSADISTSSTDSVTILGLKGMLSNMAKCCKPAPGDAIIGFITRGRGVTIHRLDCPNILNITDRDRLIQVSWGAIHNTFPVPVRIRAFDRKGLMRDISTVIDNEGINLASVGVKIKDNIAIFDMVLEIHAVSELRKVLNRIANITNVFDAQRMRPG